MSNLAWLVVALVIVGGAIGGYSALLITRSARLEQALRRAENEAPDGP